MSNLIIYYILSVLLIPLISFIGRKKFIPDYTGFTTYVVEIKKDFLKWAEYWIFFGPFMILILSLTLYYLGLNALIENIWSITLFYWINLWIYISVILNRVKLLDHLTYLLITIGSSLLSYFFYRYIILVGKDYILPNIDTIRDAVWVGFFGFFIFIINNRNKDTNFKNYLSDNHFKQRISYLGNKYDTFLSKLKSKELLKVALVILFYEDFNRPYFVRRIVENPLSRLGIVGTTGIAQVGGINSDNESVIKLVKILNSKYSISNFDPQFEYQTVKNIFLEYNGEKYADECMNLYWKVKNLKL